MKPIKYDASKLLYKMSESDRFLHSLNVIEEDKKTLLDARKKARIAIRQAFHEAKHMLKKEYLEHRRLHPSTELVLDEKREFVNITPAFWSQGSFSYNTMNNPAHLPPQQFDLDDGVYLPMDIFKEEPIYSKNIFFKIIDTALEKLSQEEGWTFINDKNTCSRIEISDEMHLDFPLYAMPRDRFEELKKTNQIALESASNTYEFREAKDEKIELDPNDVYLAIRKGDHWIKSDPKLLENWFKKSRDDNDPIHGKHRLTRVCRYLKAWRDFTWKKGGPSSIVLMVNVVYVFNRHKSFDRDCEAILAIAEELPQLFSAKIFNPAIPEGQDEEEMFQKRHSEDEKKEIISKSKELHKSLSDGLVHGKNTQDVVGAFINSFGVRIPDKNEWVESILEADLSKTPKKQPKPKVPRNIEHS